MFIKTIILGHKYLQRSCFVGFLLVALINAGSRYEVDFPSGVSHFISKLAFQVVCRSARFLMFLSG